MTLKVTFPSRKVLDWKNGKINREFLSKKVYELQARDPEKYQKLFPEPEKLIPMIYQYLNMYWKTMEKMEWVKESLQPNMIHLVIVHESEDEMVKIANEEAAYDGHGPSYWRLEVR